MKKEIARMIININADGQEEVVEALEKAGFILELIDQTKTSKSYTVLRKQGEIEE